MYKFFYALPVFFQNTIISFFNTYQYKIRHGGSYKKFREYYFYFDTKASKSEIEAETQRRKTEFLAYVKKNSYWYSSININNFAGIEHLNKLDLVNHIDQIITINKKKGILSKTGGTTGTSMCVYYKKEDMQERFAALDNFRARYGYELGKKTAWFSGKNIVSKRDIEKGLCYKEDFINKVRFFSTYDINKVNFYLYWHALNNYKPEFIVGYPSSVYDICVMASQLGLRAKFKAKVFFPTAETVLPAHREIITKILGCLVIDQYASSEGAPFITECSNGNMHINPLTGIFEYKNKNINNEVLVTSYTTRGTPLVRYAIGDSINLDTDIESCPCGSFYPVVKEIEGRKQDYIFTKDFGRINASLLTLAITKVKGILLFQLIQSEIESVDVRIVTSEAFDDAQNSIFLKHLKRIIGNSTKINIHIVDDIPREKSGKFRIVKSLLSQELSANK